MPMLPKPVDETTILLALKMLDPLPIQHKQWPWSGATRASLRGIEYARIFGGIGLKAKWARDNPGVMEQTHRIAVAAGVPIQISHSPWHAFWAQEDARGWDKRADQERDDLSSALEFVSNDLARLNEDTGAAVIIDHIFCDQEILRADLNDAGAPDPAGGQRPDQAEALRHKNAISYELCKDTFPDATYSAHGQMWGHHTTGEPHDGIADIELYTPNQVIAMRENAGGLVRATAAWNAANDDEMTASMLWVAQGGFYDFGVDPRSAGFVYKPYPVKYDHWIGRESLNPFFTKDDPNWGPHLLRGTWPSPDKKPNWVQHFIAYAAGAMLWAAGDSEDRWLEELMV